MHAAREGSVGSPANVGEYAIALQTRPGITLEEVSRRLVEAKVKHRYIYESDPPYCGQLLSIGCEPCARGKVARILSDLPSARETVV